MSEYKHLIPAFLKAMDEIGAYGEAKHRENSMQASIVKNDRSRPTERVSEQELQRHSRQHWQDYTRRMAHDHFGTLKHQLAAAAFNAMMEFYYASLDTEGTPPVGKIG